MIYYHSNRDGLTRDQKWCSVTVRTFVMSNKFYFPDGLWLHKICRRFAICNCFFVKAIGKLFATTTQPELPVIFKLFARALSLLAIFRKKKSYSCYTRDITPKGATSGGTHLYGLTPGQPPTKERRSVGELLATLCTI